MGWLFFAWHLEASRSWNPVVMVAHRRHRDRLLANCVDRQPASVPYLLWVSFAQL
jgi:hypothetical protein